MVKIQGQEINLIVYDFDGVMTNNTVIVREDGTESVICNRSDGLGINIIKKTNTLQIILSTEKNPVVTARAKKIGIPVIQSCGDKKKTIIAYCQKNCIPLKKVAYIGNDINDKPAMESVGYPICPSDAYQEIKDISKLILNAAGGKGVIRDLVACIEIEKD